jgi:hypothetical protein
MAAKIYSSLPAYLKDEVKLNDLQEAALLHDYGKVLIPNAELQLDYNMLLEEGRREKERVFTELKERLESMLPWNLMEKMKMLTENNLEILKTKAIPQPFIFI